MKQISLVFEGYFTSALSVPSKSGIYCVYRGTNNADNTVSLKGLLYVGESTDVQNRLSHHEKKPDWTQNLQYGEILIFSFAPILGDREQAEAAIINHHKPKENEEFIDSFPYGDTEMQLSGSCRFLDNHFTVRSTVRTTSLLGGTYPNYY